MAHEHKGGVFAALAFGVGQNGSQKFLGVGLGLKQGAAHKNSLKAAGVLAHVKQHGPFKGGKFFTGQNMQGLHAHNLYAVLGQLGHAVADAAHRMPLFGQLFTDDL